MPIAGLPADHSTGNGDGLAATNAMALGGIKSGDNLLAVISWDPATTGSMLGRDVADFTVADGSITAGTIDLSGLRFVAVWEPAPAA